jgi:hypothetical protein
MTHEQTSVEVLTSQDIAPEGNYAIGMRGYYTPEFALEAAEQQCYTANRLTAPFRGIETRNRVFFDGEFYHPITFPIEQVQPQG